MFKINVLACCGIGNSFFCEYKHVSANTLFNEVQKELIKGQFSLFVV